MGMGYAANYADVIKEDKFAIWPDVKKALDDLKKLLKKYGISYERFAQDVSLSETVSTDPNEEKEIQDAYKNLRDTFWKRTGLSLNIDYHDPDTGDRYDDVKGIYWWVDGMYQLTPEGEKMQNLVDRCMWVSFG